MEAATDTVTAVRGALVPIVAVDNGLCLAAPGSVAGVGIGADIGVAAEASSRLVGDSTAHRRGTAVAGATVAVVASDRLADATTGSVTGID